MPDLAPVTARPSVLRRVLHFEAHLWRSLYGWVARRPVTAEPGAVPFGHAGGVAPMFWLFIALSAVEVPVMHLLLPWATARAVSLVLGLWGLLWMVGLLATLKMSPHVVSGAGLTVRDGSSVDLTLPWDAVESVTAHRMDHPEIRTVGRMPSGDGADLVVAVNHESNLHARLCRPVTAPGPKGEGLVVGVRLWAEDPKALVAAARRHLSAQAPARVEAPADEPT